MSWGSSSYQSIQSGVQWLVLPGSDATSKSRISKIGREDWPCLFCHNLEDARGQKGKNARKKERGAEGGRVTHGSCLLSISSFPCSSLNHPLIHRLHSAPLSTAAAAAGASAWKPCSPLKRASPLQRRVKGQGECCPTLCHVSHSCTETSKTTTTTHPPAAWLPSER